MNRFWPFPVRIRQIAAAPTAAAIAASAKAEARRTALGKSGSLPANVIVPPVSAGLTPVPASRWARCEGRSSPKDVCAGL
ncbi:MAG TPA: hypothetical protein VEG44_00025 [Candidatus Acidoferrales bacterium]|nr:hypothetical protein [Candidatus Acidoferrales bacterium]